jgi:hypothetical protein
MKEALRHAALETLESRMFLSASVESIDGTGNNIAHPTWGSPGIDLIRLSPAAYADGLNSPSLASDASARAISNIVNNQADPSNPSQDLDTLDQVNLSDYGYAFGQFIDHDLDLTPTDNESFPIAVAANDPIGPNALDFTRSVYDPATGITTPRQQVTDITAYLDLSQVYGSDQATADALRTMSGGRLKTSPGNLLPYDNSTYFTATQLSAINASVGGMANNGGLPTSQLFVTGDTRGNENLELTTIDTLYVRNHNLLAGKLHQMHPNWTDEQLYQEARKINIAQYQATIYNQWLPDVFGNNALPAYRGYNPNVNASISTEFSTVAFRFGHSMVSPSIARDGNNGQPVADEVPLADDFFDSNLLSNTGAVDPYTGLASTSIDPVLKSLADGNGEAMDTMAVSAIRNFLFGDFGAGGDDLIARDVQRGRDDGIADYNTVRVAMGLKPVTSFAQITKNVQIQQELAAAYPGGVNTIDAFEGGVAEDHVPGSDVEPLFQAIIINQFARLRDGDRFFYLNEKLNPEEMSLFTQGNTLSKVISANTEITNLQPDAFIFRASIAGIVNRTPPPPGGPKPPPGVGNITVDLEDTSGNILAQTVTGPDGHYQFTNQTGIDGTGVYTVVLSLPAGAKLASTGPGNIVISRSDLNISADFTITLPAPKNGPPQQPPTLPPPCQQGGPGNGNGSNGAGSIQDLMGNRESGTVASSVLGMTSNRLVQGVVH